MKKLNVCVFPCGSEIGLEIFRSLCYSTHINLIGASSVEDHGRFVYSQYVSNLPFVDSPDFISVLLNVVKEFNIDAIYPAMDSVICVLKQNEAILGCKIISSSFETTKICLSKLATYEVLKKEFFIPKIYSSINDIKEYPVFVKPDVGYGSRGVFKAESEAELALFLEKGKGGKYVLAEYLSGEEYTVDCFTDKNGILIFSKARQRARISNGISVNTRFVDDEICFDEIAKIINSRIPFIGAWFFQVKRSVTGNLKLLEVAARLGGASSLNRNIGVNFALLSIFCVFDMDVSLCLNQYVIELDRALDNRYKIDISYDTVYVDFDDCLIINGSVNLLLVQFLFKVFNQGKKIILITKHKYQIYESLQRFRLGVMFDEIIHIKDCDEKANYITNPNAIFIDDSYSERRKVKDRCGIWVFSPDMVESLI